MIPHLALLWMLLKLAPGLSFRGSGCPAIVTDIFRVNFLFDDSLARKMEVKHCKAQHEVLLRFIRYTFLFWGPSDEHPLSYWIDHTVNRANHPLLSLVPSELKSVLTRATVLSEECCRPVPPLKAALSHAKWSQAFTDILKEIQWCVSVVSHGRACENIKDKHAPELKEFPWEARIGHHERDLLKIAEQQDWRDLMLELEDWHRDHECSVEECGNVHGCSDPRFCLATQLTRNWSGHGSSSNDSDHLSSLWKFDNDPSVFGSDPLLGSGSFAAVTRSTWLGNKYAQKVFNSGGLTSLRAEAEALAKLNHPHIVKVYACSENSLLLDLMFSDLQKFIKSRMQQGERSQPFSLPAAMDLMLQIADAVSYMHSQGIVHRDLKSSNILVDLVNTSSSDLDDGFVVVKLADFGLAKVKNEMTHYSHLTHNMGTRIYMAPEIFGANKDDDHLEYAYPMKADIYSFGIICSEILSGEVPFRDVPLSSLYSKLTNLFPLRPRLPPSCPTTLVSLICACWDADPRERPTFINVCRVLRYLKGVHIHRGLRDVYWNANDGTWPYGRLWALAMVKGLSPTSEEESSLRYTPSDIRGVKFHFNNTTRNSLEGFTITCYSEGELVEQVVGINGGYSTDWIMFDYPNEYLVQVKGSYSETTLSSMTFITTTQQYGPFGNSNEGHKESLSPRGRVVAFDHTRRSSFLRFLTVMKRGGYSFPYSPLSARLQVVVLPNIARCIQHLSQTE